MAAKGKNSVEDRKADLAKVHETLAELAAERSKVNGEIAALQARINGPVEWATLEDAKRRVNQDAEDRRQIDALALMLATYERQIAAGREAVRVAEAALREAQIDLLSAERHTQHEALADQVRALAESLRAFEETNHEVVKLGGQASTTYSLIRVPLYRTAEALHRKPQAARPENPDAERDRLGAALTAAEANLAKVRGVTKGNLDRNFYEPVFVEHVRNLRDKIAELARA